jgi:hypothetical protein
VRVVESTAILNRVIGYVKDGGLRAAGVPRYTPNFVSAEHVLDLPMYGPSNRDFELIEDKVALCEYELFNGGVTDAWRIQARNKQQPDEETVNLLPRMFRGRAAHHDTSSVVLDSMTQLKEVHAYGAQKQIPTPQSTSERSSLSEITELTS